VGCDGAQEVAGASYGRWQMGEGPRRQMNRLREVIEDLRMILRKGNPSSKFISYFELLDAFKEPGCPVCSRLERGALKTLDALLYEQVNDPVTRGHLIASHGFCNWHAWMLPRVPNSASGVAIVYRHLLQDTLEQVQAARRVSRPRGRRRWLRDLFACPPKEGGPILAWRDKKRGCSLCTSARRSEHDDLRTILEFVGEAEFAEAFARSGGLCLPHLSAAIAIGRDHPNADTLLVTQEARWRDLLWELGEFARKFDYRYADEARGREGSSWQRVLELFVGRAGVFGPERGDGLEAGTAGDQEVLPAPPETGQAAGEGSPGEAEILRHENEKLHRRVEELQTRMADAHRTRLALEFQVLKLVSDQKTVAVEHKVADRERPDDPDTSCVNTGADDLPMPTT